MLDVREFAYDMLQKAMEALQRDRRMVAMGCLIRADGTAEIYELEGGTKEAFRKALEAVKQAARNKQAIATITICGATFRAFPPWEKEKSQTKTRELPAWQRHALAEGGGRCISMDIEVPGQRSINVMVPYSMTKSGDIKFEAPEEGPLDFKGPAPPEVREEEGPLN